MTDFPNNPALNDTFSSMGRTWQWNGTAWRAVSAFQNPDWADVLNKPETFPPATHSHGISEVTGLQTALDGKQAAGSYATAAQGALADTALQPAALTPYRTSAAQDVIDAGKQPAGSYAPANHIHAPSEVTGLLDGDKIASTLLPSYVDDIIEVALFAALPAGERGKIYVTLDTGKIYRWSGSDYVEITSSPGTTTDVPEGTNLYFTNARASAAAPVQSVAGRGGSVTLTKTDVGLGNVDNTADADKPVSTAQQTALNGKANTSHPHAIADVTGLQTALDGKQTAGSYAPATGIAPSAITGTAVVDSDSRLTNSRPATAHKSSHATGGTDALTPADIGAEPTITTLPISKGGTGSTTAAAARDALGAKSPQIDRFLGSGTWTKPAGAKQVLFELVAGGGGGGAGIKVAAATISSGGAAGGSGGYSRATINAADLTDATYTVTVGAGGSGGIAGGAGGISGTNSSVAGSTLGIFISCRSGGGGGNGATPGNSTGGFAGLPQGVAGISGTAGAAGGTTGSGGSANFGPSAGGSGGGTSTTAAFAGGPGGNNSISGLPTAAAGTLGGGAGGTVTPISIPSLLINGGGGAGGGSSITSNGGAGGNASGFGCGGGGGGSCSSNTAGFVAGNGGAGAPGIVVITTYF